VGTGVKKIFRRYGNIIDIRVGQMNVALFGTF
jgi:hypothetical protein